jgi:hypothetical protein
MLYIPLAYLFLFTFSLVRLIYDMVTSKSSPFLSVSSLWAVLSVGLVDALLYVSAQPCGGATGADAGRLIETGPGRVPCSAACATSNA